MGKQQKNSSLYNTQWSGISFYANVEHSQSHKCQTMQSVLNSGQARSERLPSLLSHGLLLTFNWFPVKSRIKLKTVCITYKVLTTASQLTLVRYLAITHLNALYVQLISFFCSSCSVPLSCQEVIQLSCLSHQTFPTLPLFKC